MENSTIGIKIADGTYFPIIEDGNRKKKKLILTTVNDNQESVQIDLYRGRGNEIDDAAYIGSLVIEDILPSAKGDPEIELRLGIDTEGNLNAEAGDVGAGDRQSLSVSLESLEEDGFDTPNFEIDDAVFDDIPAFKESEEDDFSLDEAPTFDDDLSFDEAPSLDEDASFDSGMDEFVGDSVFEEDAGLGEADEFGDVSGFDDEPEEFASSTSLSEETEEDEYRVKTREKRKPLALIIIIILILIVLGVGAFLFLRDSGNEAVPPLAADGSSAAEQAPEPEPEPAVEAVDAVPDKPEPVAETTNIEPEPVPAVSISDEKPAVSTGEIPDVGRGGGVWYRLKWGDTLWNLSISFYRTPWLYGLIAVENNIKNPDVIYAGTDLFIPEN